MDGYGVKPRGGHAALRGPTRIRVFFLIVILLLIIITEGIKIKRHDALTLTGNTANLLHIG